MHYLSANAKNISKFLDPNYMLKILSSGNSDVITKYFFDAC